MSEPAMRVRCWGVRGSHPVTDPAMSRYGGNTSCVEVRFDAASTPLVIDSGTGIIGLGRELAAGDALGHEPVELLVSHLHWDHLQGFPFFAPLYGPHRIRAWTAEAPDSLLRALSAQVSPPGFPVRLADLPATVEAARLAPETPVGQARITPIPLNHPGGSTGFRVEAHGRCFVYATDHEMGSTQHDRALLEACRGADLVLLDAQYDEGDGGGRPGWGHSTWQAAARLATEAGVPELLLFHHDPSSDDDTLDAIAAEARALHPGARVAREGQTLIV